VNSLWPASRQSLVRSALLAALSACAGLTIGCGTVCDDAGTVCGFEDSIADDCSGVTECAAECIVDWDDCDVNDPESEEAQCIAVCLEAAEEGS
jgi:hypothetical protein